MFRRKHSSSMNENNNSNSNSNVNQESSPSISSSPFVSTEINKLSSAGENSSFSPAPAGASVAGSLSSMSLASDNESSKANFISRSKRNLVDGSSGSLEESNQIDNSNDNIEADDEEDDEEDDDPVIAKAKITILNGKHLRNVQTLINQDPYVIISVQSGDKDKTKVLHRAGTNPVWTDENKLRLRIRKSDNEILVSAYDYENLRSDQLIGKGKILLSDHPHGCVEEKITIILDDNDEKKSDGVINATLTLQLLQRKTLSRKDRSRLRSESLRALWAGKTKLPKGLSVKGNALSSSMGSVLSTISETSIDDEMEQELTRFEAFLFLIKELNTFEGRVVGILLTVFFLLLIFAPDILFAFYDFLFWFKWLYYILILMGIYVIYPEMLGRALTYIIVTFATHGYPLSFHAIHIHPFITSDYRLNLRLVVEKFRLGNPPGFEGRDFFSAERVDIELSAPFSHIYNAATLRFETVHLKKQHRFRRLITFNVHHIEFQGLVIDFQLSKGKLNINELGRAFADAEVRKSIGKSAPIPNLLHVKVIRARNLLAMDSNGLSDPYFIASVRRKTFKSSVIPKTLNPLWVEEYKFQISDPSAVFHLALYDHDIGSSDFLGQWLITLKWLAIDPYHCNKCENEVSIDSDGWLKGWFPLCDKKFLRLGKCGDVQLELKWYYADPKNEPFEDEPPPLKALDQLIENSNETNLKLGNQQEVINMLNTIPVLLDIQRVTVRGVRFYLEDLFRGRTGASEGLVAKGKSKLSANAVKISILDWTSEFRPKYGDEGITIFKVLYKFFRHLAPKVMGSGKLGQALSQTTSGLAQNFGEDIMNLFKGEFGKVGAVVLAKNTLMKAGAEVQSTAKHIKKKLFASSNAYVRRLTGEDTADYMVQPTITGYLDIAWSKSSSRLRAYSGSAGTGSSILRSGSIGGIDSSKKKDDSPSPIKPRDISRSVSLDATDLTDLRSNSLKEIESVQISSSTKINISHGESQSSVSFFNRIRRFSSSKDGSSPNLQSVNEAAETDESDIARKISAPKSLSRAISLDNSSSSSKRNLDASQSTKNSPPLSRDASSQLTSPGSPVLNTSASKSLKQNNSKPPLPDSGKSSWIKNLSLFSNTNLGPRTRFKLMYFEIRGSLFLCRKKSKVSSASKNLCIDLSEVSEIYITAPPEERAVIHVKYGSGKVLFLRIPRPAKLAIATGSFQTEQNNPPLQDWLERLSKLSHDIQEGMPKQDDQQNESLNHSMAKRSSSGSTDQSDLKKKSLGDDILSDDDDEPDLFSDDDNDDEEDEDDGSTLQRKITSEGSASGSPTIERKRFRFGFGSR